MPVPEVDSDTQLIEQAKTNPQALANLYRLHYPRIAGYVFRRLGRTPDAEDVIANSFLAMVKGLCKFSTSGPPFLAWLYRIATNEINRWRRRQRIRRFFHLTRDQPAPDSPSTDLAEELRLALWKLPTPFQDVIALHYLEQQSVLEIAQSLGISEGTVKSRLARGRAQLRQIITHRQQLEPNRSPRPEIPVINPAEVPHVI